MLLPIWRLAAETQFQCRPGQASRALRGEREPGPIEPHAWGDMGPGSRAQASVRSLRKLGCVALGRDDITLTIRRLPDHGVAPNTRIALGPRVLRSSLVISSKISSR